MMNRLFLLILTGSLLMAGCNSDTKTVYIASPAKAPLIMDPFRFHKMIEVSPGNDFDIFSWGRGSSAVGSFLILHSDSADMKYTTTTGDLDGSIVDVYNSDMDMDGNPEILIQAKATDTTNYAVIYAFEFTDGKAEKLDFPKLTSAQRQGYRGSDNFYIQDGAFMREFPIYDGSGKDAKPTGQKRLLQYGLRNNEFTVTQLSKDSTFKVTNNPAIREIPTVKKKTTPAKKAKHTAKKKHIVVEHKKKKKKYHH